MGRHDTSRLSLASRAQRERRGRARGLVTHPEARVGGFARRERAHGRRGKEGASVGSGTRLESRFPGRARALSAHASSAHEAVWPRPAPPRARDGGPRATWTRRPARPWKAPSLRPAARGL